LGQAVSQNRAQGVESKTIEDGQGSAAKALRVRIGSADPWNLIRVMPAQGVQNRCTSVESMEVLFCLVKLVRRSGP